MKVKRELKAMAVGLIVCIVLGAFSVTLNKLFQELPQQPGAIIAVLGLLIISWIIGKVMTSKS